MANSYKTKPSKFLLQGFFKLLTPYWKKNPLGWVLLISIISLTAGGIYLNTVYNEWFNNFYTAIQDKNLPNFNKGLLFFCVIAAINVIVVSSNAYLKQTLTIHWRHWLSRHYMSIWMKNGNFYRQQFTATSHDNPDQRIAEDLNEFVVLTFTILLGIASDLAMVATFLKILWDKSQSIVLSLSDISAVMPDFLVNALSGIIDFNGSITLPNGYLVYFCFSFALIGTILTFLIGHPLVKLNFKQQRFEADFRYNLVHVRENAENIALYKGVNVEQMLLSDSFSHVVKNFFALLYRELYLNFFMISYHRIATILPYIIVSPLLFAKVIKLGDLMQIVNCFNFVVNSLTTIMDNFTNLARWKSVIDRLVSFRDSLEESESLEKITPKYQGSDVVLKDVTIKLPNGNTLLDKCNLTLKQGDSVTIKGPSGCGKSTLLKTIAGLWPFASGSLVFPENLSIRDILFLSQKPYLPIGTLADAICYPCRSSDFKKDEIIEALKIVDLSHLQNKLLEKQPWEHILSIGEQQRLAFARVFLVKPQILFLDESSAAIDEPLEQRIFSKVMQDLPNSIIIGVNHRSSANKFHKYIFDYKQNALITNDEVSHE